MFETISQILNTIDGIVWGPALMAIPNMIAIFALGGGAFFTIKFGRANLQLIGIEFFPCR
jgi:hypothetical protein